MKITLTSNAVRYTVEVEGLTFVLRPQMLADRVAAMGVLEELDIDASNLRAGALVVLDVMTALCIESWEGVEIDEKPAECSKENKLLLASQFPHIIAKVRNEYEAQLASAEGNSGSTPGGSGTSGGRKSAKTAPDGQSSKKDEPLDAVSVN